MSRSPVIRSAVLMALTCCGGPEVTNYCSPLVFKEITSDAPINCLAMRGNEMRAVAALEARGLATQETFRDVTVHVVTKRDCVAFLPDCIAGKSYWFSGRIEIAATQIDLLAHEMWHVAKDSSGQRIESALHIGDPDVSYEAKPVLLGKKP